MPRRWQQAGLHAAAPLPLPMPASSGGPAKAATPDPEEPVAEEPLCCGARFLARSFDGNEHQSGSPFSSLGVVGKPAPKPQLQLFDYLHPDMIYTGV
jgi:hypothetical protein